EPAPGGRDHPETGRQHGVAHRPRHASGRKMRRLRRMRTLLSHGHPLESPQPEDGERAQGALRPGSRDAAPGEGAADAVQGRRRPVVHQVTTKTKLTRIYRMNRMKP